MSTDHKVCIRDEYGVFNSWEAWQKFHRDRKDIDRLSEYAKALKEENKRLREALEKIDSILAFDSSIHPDSPVKISLKNALSVALNEE